MGRLRAIGAAGAGCRHRDRVSPAEGDLTAIGIGDDEARKLANAILGQLRLIMRTSKRHFQRIEKRVGLSGAQLWALSEVERTTRLSLRELAEAMAIHQSTASNLVDRLEKRGLLTRDHAPGDRRLVRLSLTSSGRLVLVRAPAPLDGVLPEALRALNRSDLVDLQRRLRKLVRSMKVRDDSGTRVLLGDM